ncbi:MAG TPA: hypothetical protein VN687_06155 [Blastocatellia bacterium]|nr:hypothetical protein [Blastocatellia bacterium]
MPGGPTGMGLIGLAAFPAIKFTGYALAGRFLKHRYQDPGISSIKFGAARTVLGIFAGITYACLVGSVKSSDTRIYLGLAPVRIVEWLLIIWIFFEYGSLTSNKQRLIGYSLLGVVWSYFLDLFGLLPLIIIPGWFWVC